MSPDALEVESTHAYVLFHPRTGEIVHVHRVFRGRGVQARGDQVYEAQARELAGRFGHRTEGLRVIRVNTEDLKLGAPQRIDLKSLRLVGQETSTRARSKGATRVPRERKPRQGRS